MLFPDYRFKMEFIETLFKCGYWLRCWGADRHRSNYSRHYVDTIQWQSQYKERLKHHITGPLCGESTSQSTSNVERVFMSSWTWWNINCVWDCHQKSSSFSYCHSPIHHWNVSLCHHEHDEISTAYEIATRRVHHSVIATVLSTIVSTKHD